MEYFIALGLLVAVAAWVVSGYHRLQQLRGEVCTAWQQWVAATHRRNACLSDFASLFSMMLPQGDLLPRSLRRLTSDSEHSLRLAPEPHWGAGAHFFPVAEAVLRRAVHDSMETMEGSSVMRGHERLQQLCSRMTGALQRQDMLTMRYNRAVQSYNGALDTPSGRMLAPLFRFTRAGALNT